MTGLTILFCCVLSQCMAKSEELPWLLFHHCVVFKIFCFLLLQGLMLCAWPVSIKCLLFINTSPAIHPHIIITIIIIFSSFSLFYYEVWYSFITDVTVLSVSFSSTLYLSYIHSSSLSSSWSSFYIEVGDSLSISLICQTETCRTKNKDIRNTNPTNLMPRQHDTTNSTVLNQGRSREWTAHLCLHRGHSSPQGHPGHPAEGSRLSWWRSCWWCGHVGAAGPAESSRRLAWWAPSRTASTPWPGEGRGWCVIACYNLHLSDKLQGKSILVIGELRVSFPLQPKSSNWNV